jgi:hypothetical protein
MTEIELKIIISTHPSLKYLITQFSSSNRFGDAKNVVNMSRIIMIKYKRINKAGTYSAPALI